MMKQKPIIICGPTASGKSDYALDLAGRCKGAIINGDSMQIYKDLPILTAQPSQSEQKKIPHNLYGILSGDDPCSVARWREMVLQEIDWCDKHNLRPIIVGGTGMYLSSLINGLTGIPEIEPEIRMQTRELYKKVGSEAFYNKLTEVDPEVASQLNQNDHQRLIRAYEVKVSTGISLGLWHEQSEKKGFECEIKIIMRPRDILHQRAADRFDQMLKEGAIEEVKMFLQKGYDPNLPIMKALGVVELAKYIQGEWSRDVAREKAIIATRQYIKRQLTWFRHQLPEAEVICLQPGNDLSSLQRSD